MKREYVIIQLTAKIKKPPKYATGRLTFPQAVGKGPSANRVVSCSQLIYKANKPKLHWLQKNSGRKKQQVGRHALKIHGRKSRLFSLARFRRDNIYSSGHAGQRIACVSHCESCRSTNPIEKREIDDVVRARSFTHWTSKLTRLSLSLAACVWFVFLNEQHPPRAPLSLNMIYVDERN
jgi:hypothetical protein